jgi:predicted HicB family RNase H-like nuclease
MRINIRLDAQLHEEAKAAAAEERQTLSAFIGGSLREWLESHPHPHK